MFTCRSYMFVLVGSMLALAGVSCGTQADPAADAGAADDARAAAAASREIFEQRIMPIFKSPKPSSCVQCHLAGVDLKNYILPSHEKTFVSLRDQGLIDMDQPGKSKILELIEMGGRYVEGEGPNLIHAKVRQKEYEAFAAWVKASCADPKLRNAPPLARTEIARPPRPDAVIRHARKDRILEAFEDTIWAQRFRCAGCHMPGKGNNAKLVAKFGKEMNWLKTEGPEATLEYLVNSRLIDTEDPEKSLLLRKPIVDGVKHGGGKKMSKGDLGYKAYRRWLEDYAAVVKNQYAKAEELPDVSGPQKHFISKNWLRISPTPPGWANRMLQVTLHRWDAKRKAWEKDPIAISDHNVWGKGKLWQSPLQLLAVKDSQRAKGFARHAQMPPGRYLVRVHVDAKQRLLEKWNYVMTRENFIGQTVLTVKRWPVGPKNRLQVNPNRLRKNATDAAR